jgi:hypothetical protein
MNEVVTFSEARRFATGKVVTSVSGSHHYAASIQAFAFTSGSASIHAFVSEEPLRAHSAGWVKIANAEDWQRFRILTENWRKERGIASSVTKMVMCPSYQRIIGMGGRVVPLILREMENEGDDPDHWFWALEMITGADPVPVEAYGDTVQMAQAWRSWAEGRYVW